MRSSRHIAGALAGLAAAGVVVAHELSFRLLEPDSHERLHRLRDTGHAHWTLVTALSLALLVGGIAMHGLGVWRKNVGVSTRVVSTRLAAMQLIGFFALEAIERSATAGELVLPFGDRALQLGLVLQLVTAVLGALLLSLLTRAVALVALICNPHLGERSEAALRWFDLSVPHVSSLIGTGAGTLRGPPEPSL
jgi:hypothetical protein